MLKTNAKLVGAILVVSGSFIAATGAYVNNCWLDHILAMQIWRFSNILMFAWSVGLCRRWWDGGLPALCLAGTYAFYGITNEIGLR